MGYTAAADKLKTHRVSKELPFLVRAVWFFVLGWELTAVWIVAAWAFNLTIIGLPVGLWMINRVPQVLTLKSQPGMLEIDLKSGRSRFVAAPQTTWLLRLIYFVLLGWRLSLVWAAAAWLLCLTIIGLPIGVLMLHALPTVTTLQQG